MESEEEKKNKKRILDKEYREKNKELLRIKQKEYNLKNNEVLKIKRKEYNLKNKDKAKEFYKNNYAKNKDKVNEYYKNNKDKIKEKRKEYIVKNKDKINNKIREYRKERLKNDDLFKSKKIISNLISKSIKRNGYSKNSKTNVILGCNYEFFKEYLESKWESWMNWGNYGNWDGIAKEVNVSWDIDHIIPSSSAITEEELIKLNHYTNLKPLCSYTNRFIKRNNIK